MLFPFNYIKRKYNSGNLKLEKKEIPNLKIEKSMVKEKILEKYFFPFLEYTGLKHFISNVKLTDGFCSWVKEFNPDIIYAQAATRSNLLFCSLVASHFNKPFIFHMMDDWPSTISDKGLFKNYWQGKIDKELRALLKKTTLLMSISTCMSNEYKRRYGKESIVFHNPINIKFWEQYEKKDYNLSDCPKILYAGRIGLGIESSLEVIAKSIQKLNEDFLIPAKFILCIQQIPIWAKNYSCIEIKGYTSYELVPKTFSEADFLILPYDFSLKSIKYIKYSMPTKASEYMMSGTPIILFAPESTAVVKYATEYEWAQIVTKNSDQELIIAIKDLIQNKPLREKIGKNAKMVAEANHNSMKVASDFKKIICNLANKSNEQNV
jgi:glycosyltransferase involved in cell wall biosynthesis